jgi:pimeloyl-ACP methyl ester carboxylesterase
LATSFDPIRPVPPITTIFIWFPSDPFRMGYPQRLADPSALASVEVPRPAGQPGRAHRGHPAAAHGQRVHRTVRAPGLEDHPVLAVIGTGDQVIPPAELTFMAKRAGARITDVDAGHLSLISEAPLVTRVILEAVQATG